MNDKLFSNKVLVSKALVELQEWRVLFELTDQFGPTVYQVDRTVSLTKVAAAVEPASPYYKASRFGREWIESAVVRINEKYQGDDDEADGEQHGVNSDDGPPWEPLPLDRTDPNFEQAMEVSEKAIEAIEVDNGFAANLPDERNAIVKIARGTLEAVRDGTPSIAQIKSGLLSPFRYIAHKFPEAAIGVAAKLAFEALKKWLGF